MPNNEFEIFEENNKKLMKMDKEYSIEDAIKYLIDAKAFENEKVLFEYLNQYPSTKKALGDLMKKELMLYGFDKDYIDRYKNKVLEIMVDKVVQSNKIKYPYFDTIAKKYNIFTYKYSHIESNWYLAHIYIEEILDDIESTVLHFRLNKSEEMGDFYITDAIEYYYEYISKYANKNERDEKILKRLSKLFCEDTVVSFANIEKKSINFSELEMCMSTINPINEGFYDVDHAVFLTQEQMDYVDEWIDDYDRDEEYETINIEYDVQDVLKRFIGKMPYSMVEKYDIYELFYGKKSFRRCKEAFSKCGVLNKFYKYLEAEALLNCFGWCILNHYEYEDKHVDWLKELRPFKNNRS